MPPTHALSQNSKPTEEQSKDQNSGQDKAQKTEAKSASGRQDKQDTKPAPDKAKSGGDETKKKNKDQEEGDTTDEADLINPDRPGIANGSQVIGPRRFQIETGIEQDTLGGVKNRSHLLTVPTLLRYGIDSRYELRIETAGYGSQSTDSASGTLRTSGLNPVSFGFKRQFQASKGATHPSFGTIVRLFPASGSGAFRTNHFTADALLAMDWDFAPHLSLNPNIGYATYEDSNGRAFGNFHLANTLSYACTQQLGFFIDFGLQSPESAGGGDALIYDFGATYILGRNIQFDASFGTGVHGQTVPHPFWSAGVSVRF